jgi:hypothetical protein
MFHNLHKRLHGDIEKNRIQKEHFMSLATAAWPSQRHPFAIAVMTTLNSTATNTKVAVLNLHDPRRWRKRGVPVNHRTPL